MLKLTNLIIIVLAAGLLNFCATTYTLGKQYSTENVVKIIIGKTSEDDIRSYFGDPWKTGIINGNNVYTYSYEEVIFNHDDSVERNGHTLIIEFDEDKHVLNYYFNIPGKEVSLISLIMHRNIMLKQEQEQVAWQNQASAIHNE